LACASLIQASAQAAQPVSAFAARFTGSRVVLTWRVAAGQPIAFFAVDRATAASTRRVQVARRIAGGRRAYRFVDAHPPLRAIVRYWLTAVRRDGSRAHLRPVSVIT
jgi:hypothetical protein